MSDMRDLLKKLYDKNAEFGWDQEISNRPLPDRILMIDEATRRLISPQMRALYDFATSWKEAITGFDIVDPGMLDDAYENKDIAESIALKAEDYKPVPPSDPTDWSRTALLAVEDGGRGLGLCFYWWKHDSDVEPCVIYISGGTVMIFIDLTECAEYLANGTFPERGDQILKELRNQRGTLCG
jgi:hypothetical protein